MIDVDARRMHRRLMKASFGLLLAALLFSVIGNAVSSMTDQAGDEGSLKDQGVSEMENEVTSLPEDYEQASEFFQRLGLGGSLINSSDFAAGLQALPAGFASEVLDVSSYEQVLVSEDAGIVGLISAEDAGTAFSRVSEELSAKGWTKVDSGQANQATFLKEDGSFRWLLLSGTDTSAGSTLVMVLDERGETNSE